MELFKHEHPLKLIDFQPLYPNYEVEYSDDDHHDDDEKEEEVLIPKQDFRCLCDGCGEEINYFHRYYYSCDQCKYSLHKYCGSKIPKTLSLPSHPHNALTFSPVQYSRDCSICNKYDKVDFYRCLQCPFDIDLGCVAKEGVKCETIYHPSHRHPLVPIPRQILADCDACGKKYEGIFYLCSYDRYLIHKDCAFQPNKLLTIQHTHPLTLAYSFPSEEQSTKHYPRCRLCNNSFFGQVHHWIYKCEDCRYYAHLDCVTSGKEPKLGMVKNFEDADHPDLLHLPFLDETGSILKHFLFFKQKESSREHDETNEINVPNLHKHPLIQVDTQRTMLTSSGISSCHDPMKIVQLLCNGCVRPITSMPFYKCAYDHEDHRCNFVLHEWCTRLPCELKHHPCHHPQHTLVFVPHVPRNSLGLFNCDVCSLPSNGFAYTCVECESYYIDVNCAFIPKHVTHEAHSNHLLSMVSSRHLDCCYLCNGGFYDFSWSCQDCDFYLHLQCALLLPKAIRHKFDKHPMKLSYIPIENHKSDYFCEVCEEELDPMCAFYHCHECGWSIHSACAPLILQCKRNTYSRRRRGVYEYVNIKFGGIHKIKDHPHPLKFLQGLQSDGQCSALHCTLTYKYSRTLQHKLILKCLQCKFAVHHARCCKIMNDID